MKGLDKFEFILLALLTISGCAQEDKEDYTTQQPSVSREWYRIVNTDTIYSVQISYILTGESVTFGTDIVRTSFLYHSMNGNDTLTLSGAVCWPANTNNCTTIWLDNHFTTTKWNQCPTQMIMPGFFICTIKKAICVAPDYQGLGLSKELPQPYFNSVLLANQSVDCLKAALTLIQDCGPDLIDDFNTYNMGYSLGGAVSMGVAKQIESSAGLRSLTHLKKTMCGDGPYDQNTLFNKFLNNPGQSLDYPLEFPCAIMSVLHSSPSLANKYSYRDIFTDKLVSSGILDSINSRLYDTDQINLMLKNADCSTMLDMLSYDILDSTTNMSKDFRNEFEKLNLTTGWSPQIPILFCHSAMDSVVPVECVGKIQENMKDNPNITYHILPSGTHWSVAVEFYKNVFFGRYSN